MLTSSLRAGFPSSREALLLRSRSIERIRTEFRMAEEYFHAAEALHKSGLYTPAVTLSSYSSAHAALAAFLTTGSAGTQGGSFSGFISSLQKFSSKLDPFLEKLFESRREWGFTAAIDYSENESLMRVYQARDLLYEVKDFLRRTVRG